MVCDVLKSFVDFKLLNGKYELSITADMDTYVIGLKICE